MTPSAFISYSWDDDIHKEWVRKLAKRLRQDGVDVTLDRWATAPGDQLTTFMEQAIRENQFILIICTPNYKNRSDERKGGVGYEGDIMTAEAITTQNDRKFIPILRKGTWDGAAPSWLKGKYYINLSSNPYSEENYEDLVRTLLGKRETAPPIGKPMGTISRVDRSGSKQLDKI
ncbi:MAG: toll/interleukin-1 receptor domain-containing protein, partial [Gemmatimonadota bacterium]|nr:toll/interleukin-1 receptor domain-containing protein [Gemmatimonadota bacterium]